MTELLAPAGNWDCARAAVANGADAIFFGLPRFNARMRADNFKKADLPELMEFLHPFLKTNKMPQVKFFMFHAQDMFHQVRDKRLSPR